MLRDSLILASQVVWCQDVQELDRLIRRCYPVFGITRSLLPAISRLSAGLRTPLPDAVQHVRIDHAGWVRGRGPRIRGREEETGSGEAGAGSQESGGTSGESEGWSARQ